MVRLIALTTASASSLTAGLGDLRAQGSGHVGIPWARLLPLWRHVVWLVALFIVLAVSVTIRLDVQRLQMDLDRNDRAQRAALVLHERLQLELDARHRLQAVEGMAEQLGATPDAEVILVPSRDGGAR